MKAELSFALGVLVGILGAIFAIGLFIIPEYENQVADLKSYLSQSGHVSQGLRVERDAFAGELNRERERSKAERETLIRLLSQERYQAQLETERRRIALAGIASVDLDYLDVEIVRGLYGHGFYIEHPELQTWQTGDTDFNRNQVHKYEVLRYLVQALRGLR